MKTLKIMNVVIRQEVHSEGHLVEENVEERIDTDLIARLENFGYFDYSSLSDVTVSGQNSISYSTPAAAAIFPKVPQSVEEFGFFLNLGVAATKALSAIHEAGYCAGIISSDRYLLSSDSNLVIIGLGTIRRSYSDFDLSKLQKIDYQYVAPEFNARTNEAPDRRADFYSLGILLHYWLTGSYFISGKDSQEIMHQHLIKNYSTPEDGPWSTTGIHDIISGLLAKNPEFRYQSSQGIIKDLTSLQVHHSTGKYPKKFSLSTDYNPGVLNFNTTLYGRSGELDELISIYDKVKKGAVSIVFIEGAEGVGKTRLGNAFKDVVEDSETAYSYGRSDQFQSSDYLVFHLAFQNIAKRILIKSGHSHSELGEFFKKGVGADLSLLFDVIPDLKELTGFIEPPEKLNPIETQNRFLNVFVKYCRTLDRLGMKRILFFDDAQWCDKPSLKLIEHLINSPISRVMFVLAYNKKYLSENHSLWRFKNDIVNSDKNSHVIELKALSRSATQQMVSEMLSEHGQSIRELSKIIFEKTYGNPYHINNLIRSLQESKILFYRQEIHKWVYSLNQVKNQEVADNVATIVENQIKLQAYESQILLKIAAFNNGWFDLPLLSQIGKTSPEISNLLLNVLVEAGLLTKIDPNRGPFAFNHKRIQEVALDLDIPGFEFAPENLHCKIALYKLQEPRTKNSVELNQLVYHLMQSKKLLPGEVVKDAIACAVRAGNLANDSNSPTTAKTFLEFGLELSGQLQVKEYEYELLIGLSKAYFLLDELDQGKEFATRAKVSAKDDRGKIEVLLLTMNFYEAYSYHEENIAAGLEVLHLLDKTLEDKFYEGEAPHLIDKEYQLFKSLIASKGMGESLLLKQMLESMDFLYMDALANMTTSTLFVNLDLYALIVLKMTNHTLRCGYSDPSSYALVHMGSLLIHRFEDFEIGMKLGELGLILVNRSKSDKYSNRTFSTYFGLLGHFKEPYLTIRSSLDKKISYCMDMGDYLCMNSLYRISVRNQLLSGSAFSETLNECSKAIELMPSNYSDCFKAQLSLIRNGLLILQNKYTEEHESDDQEAIDLLKEKRCYFIIAEQYVFKSWIYCFMGNYDKAYQLLQMNDTFIEYATSQPQVLRQKVLRSVCELMLDGNYQGICVNNVEKLHKSLSRWADYSPENFKAEFELVEFIISCRKRDYALAVTKIEKVLKWSEQGNLITIRALICDLGRKLLPREEFGFISNHLKLEKTKIDKEWAAKLNTKDSDELVNYRNTRAKSASTSFDTQSLIKATQALSAEVNLDGLVHRLLNIVMENAGADKGALILIKQQVPYLEAIVDTKNQADTNFSKVKLDSFDGLPTNLIEHVISTTKELSLVDVNKINYQKESYFRKNPVCSFSILPLLKQTDLVGVLYLENSHVTGLFAEGDLEVLRIIASQAAISITNTVLYEQSTALNEELASSQKKLGQLNIALEERIKQRTKYLQQEIEMRKKAERNLLYAKNDADSANNAKSQFLANMSHEIRTPLNAIVGFSQILTNQSKDLDLSYKFERYLNNIHQSAESLSEIINDILDLSKIEAGKLTIAKTDINLKQIVMSVCRINRSLGKVKGVNFVHNWDTSTPIYVHSDGGKLKQILMNIINNAIKFTSADKNVYLKVKRDKTWLVFSVVDEGIGIPESQLKNIFNPFIQADAGINRKFGGTGLGLTITKRLVEMLNGSIEVKSKLDKGTSFTVYIPYEKSKSSASDLPDTSIATFRIPASSKILVVEDNPMNQEMIRALFSEMGSEILLAKNGQTGIDIAKKYNPDIIFMDIHMPKLDGFETVKKIRTFDTKVPIIGLSANAFREHKEAALKAGFYDYLTKPIQMSELVRVLKKYLVDVTVGTTISNKTLSRQQKQQRKDAIKALERLPIFETEKLVAAAEPLNSLLTPKEFNKLEEAIFSGDDMALKDILAHSVDDN